MSDKKIIQPTSPNRVSIGDSRNPPPPPTFVKPAPTPPPTPKK